MLCCIGGLPHLKTEMLYECDTNSSLLPYGNNEKQVTLQRTRDVFKKAILNQNEVGYDVMFLGIENQNEIHYAMPVRTLIYDGMKYAQQIEEIMAEHRKERTHGNRGEFLGGFHKDDRIAPIITVVLYFGKKKWDASMTLKEMMKAEGIREEELKYISDYKINLVEARNLKENDLAKFQSDLKQVFGFLRYDDDKEQLKAFLKRNEKEFQKMDKESYEMIEAYAHVDMRKYIQINEEGEIEMCKAIDDMCKDSRMEGLHEGMITGMLKGKEAGIIEGKRAGIMEGKQSAIIDLYEKQLITKDIALKELAINEMEFKQLLLNKMV